MNLSELEILSSLFVFFALYSFLGWCLELIYRSVKQRHWVNPGFLSGPFLPIYGTGATMIILLGKVLAEMPLVWQYLIIVLLSTIIEYYAGYIFETYYNMQLWDYRNTPLNYRGLIALPFSLLWGLLGLLLLYIVHPVINSLVIAIPLVLRVLFSILFTLYLIWDITKSGILLHRLENFLGHYLEKDYEIEALLSHLRPFRRLLETYPKMRHTLSEALAHIRLREELIGTFVNRQKQKLSHLFPDKFAAQKNTKYSEGDDQ